MKRARGSALVALTALLSGCAAPPRWQDDAVAALAAARRAQQDVVVYFALPGRDASDRMERQTLPAPEVLAALRYGDFAALRVDGFARKNLYQQWVGGGEGMGIAVLDGNGEVYAARPGPQDPGELAALLRLCAASRPSLRQARAAVAQAPADARAQHALGCLLLELGCRIAAEPALVTAAQGGVADARHRLARLYALDGNVQQARRWLQHAPKTTAAQVTEGYLLFKERKHTEAAAVLERAVAQPDIGADRQRALLYLGKSLHEAGRDDRAVPLLQALAAEGTGSWFEASAVHTLTHIAAPDHGHSH